MLADRYLMADEVLGAAGLSWYEVSNWAASPDARCRHNLAYWHSANWWGIGPGAHSHVDGTRWWNVKHPSTYAARLADGASPAQAREELSPEDRRVESVMLGVRLREGLALDDLDDTGRAGVCGLVDGGLLDATAYAAGRAVLTVRGRLLADAVVRVLLGWEGRSGLTSASKIVKTAHS
jgi:oxygen-independent coproporphyrinogen-3 oxidase